MAFNPEHKVSYDQLSKSLQDKLTTATAGVSELQKLIEEAKKSITSLVDSSTSTIGTKIDTLKTKIATESSETNVVIEQKKQEITNNLKSASGQTTAKLMSGESGQFGKVDPSNKILFGDNGFDVILVYSNISTQEKSQLTALTPNKIVENYGVNSKRVQAAFDLDKRKLLIYNGTTWQDIEDQDKVTEYFSKYLTNRSFYLNPLTKNLYFYCFDGKWTLINRLVNTGIEDIGKIIGNIGEIKYDSSLLMPEVTTPIKPPKPPVSNTLPTKGTLRRNEGDFVDIGKFLIYPKLYMRRESNTDPNRRYLGGSVIGVYKSKLNRIIKTGYGQDVLINLDQKFMNEANSSPSDLYIPKLTINIFDKNIFNFNDLKFPPYSTKAINPVPSRTMTISYDDLVSGRYNNILDSAVSYVIYQKDFNIKFMSDLQNNVLSPHFLTITSAPLIMGNKQITPNDILKIQRPNINLALNIGRYNDMYDIHSIYDYSVSGIFGRNEVDLDLVSPGDTGFRKKYIDQLTKNYFNEPGYSEYIPERNVIDFKYGKSTRRIDPTVKYMIWYMDEFEYINSRNIEFDPRNSSISYLLPTNVPNTTPIKDEYLLSGELHLKLWTGMETFGK